MSYSVWVRESMTVMRRWDRSFETKQAARQAAWRKELRAFHVLRDRDELPIETPKTRQDTKTGK